jgi:uncharacterized membrane protein YidH (DUF202 family)
MSNEGEKPKNVIEEILDKLGALVTAAFGLVAALAWNEAIQTIFKEVFGTQQAIPLMIGYAIIVTVIAVVLTLIIARAITKAKQASSKLGHNQN